VLLMFHEPSVEMPVEALSQWNLKLEQKDLQQILKEEDTTNEGENVGKYLKEREKKVGEKGWKPKEGTFGYHLWSKLSVTYT